MDKANKKILIVEDDQFLRDFYQELLTTEGYTVDIAGDGEAGLAKVREGGWSLILLDIMLPKMDGLQILRSLKEEPAKQQNGPVVALTNLGNDTVINQAFELGATGYLVKSAMDPNEVLTEIHSYLEKAANAQ